MIEIRPLGENLGADIAGVDLSRPIGKNTWQELHGAWLDRVVLRFRDQNLDDDQLKAFSIHFGELEYAPMGRITDQERARVRNPFVTIISNIVENGRSIGGLGALDAAWHSDMSYIDLPAKASLLYAVEVPPAGGDTHFADMYAAYDALPTRLKERIGALRLKHDAAHNSVGVLRRGFADAANPAEAPGAVHPIVRTHPETRRKCLFLGRRQDAYVMGLSLEDSQSLLDEVWQYATLPGNCWTQRWKVRDVVIWDNRCAMHRRDGFANQSRRLMRRTQIKGEPVA